MGSVRLLACWWHGARVEVGGFGELGFGDKEIWGSKGGTMGRWMTRVVCGKGG